MRPDLHVDIELRKIPCGLHPTRVNGIAGGRTAFHGTTPKDSFEGSTVSPFHLNPRSRENFHWGLRYTQSYDSRRLDSTRVRLG